MRINTYPHIPLQENFCSTSDLSCFEETNVDSDNQKKTTSLNSDTFESTLREEDLYITDSNIWFLVIHVMNEIGELSTVNYIDYFFGKNLKSVSQIDENKERIVNKLKSYQLYSLGWDGYDGVPPLNQAILDAINLLEKLPKNCPLPYVSLSGDGEIGFFWEVGDIFVDVGFFGDHTFSYFARDAKNEKYFGDDILLSNNLPFDLMQVIYSTE